MSRDEGVLLVTDQPVELGREAKREQLGEELGHQVYQADAAVIAQGGGVHAFGQ